MLKIKIINVAENGKATSTKVDLGKENKNFQNWEEAQRFIMGFSELSQKKMSKAKRESLEKEANLLCEAESKERMARGQKSIWA